jgi:hypothetical protein
MHQNPNPVDEDRKPQGLNRRKRDHKGPYGIEYRSTERAPLWRILEHNPWIRWRNGYTTAMVRDQALEQLQRKYSFYDWRAVNPDGPVVD